MLFVTYRSVFYAITGMIVFGALLAVVLFGLRPSIDFTGGALLQVSYEGVAPSREEIVDRVSTIPLGNISVRESGEGTFIIRTRDITLEEKNAILSVIGSPEYVVTEDRFTGVGPSLGSELIRKAAVALLFATLGIMAYVAYTFRRVSKPVSSLVYGAIVIVILFHDVLIAVGFYALLGAFTSAEVDPLFIVALLAIIGYSVNDTIIVFDRVRERLSRNAEKEIHEPFENTVGTALEETYMRSLNTSGTTALALLALFFFGASATENFALTLLVGVVAGTYSSIFLAAPLLATYEKHIARKKKKQT